MLEIEMIKVIIPTKFVWTKDEIEQIPDDDPNGKCIYLASYISEVEE
jgi:hypothetical protein